LLTRNAYNWHRTKIFASKDAMSRPSNNRTSTLILAACCGAIVAVAAFTIHRFTATPLEPLTTASVTRNNHTNGIVLVPDGEGTCHKYNYGNDTGKSTYAGTVDCDSSRPKDSRSNLPPALRGMQDSLKR
jgi:hypothetical protein